MKTTNKKIFTIFLMVVLAFAFSFTAVTQDVNAAAKKPTIQSMKMVKGFKFRVDKKNHTAWPNNKPTVRLSWSSVPGAYSYDISFRRDNGTGGNIGTYTQGTTTVDFAFYQDMVAPLKITVKALNSKGKTISSDTKYVALKDFLHAKDGKPVKLYSSSQSNIKSKGSAEKMPIVTLSKDASGAIVLYQCKCTKKSSQNWKFSPGQYGETYGDEGFEIKWFPVNVTVKANMYEDGRYRFSQSITTTWMGTIKASATKSGKAVKGVQFSVYKSDKKTKVAAMTTDKNGTCKVSVLPGKYYVKMTAVPKGYKNKKEGKDVVVENEKTTSAKFTVSKKK